MKFFLFIGGAVSGLLGLLFFLAAKSAIHEIEAFVLLLIGAVLIGCASIVGAIQKLAAPDTAKTKSSTESTQPKPSSQRCNACGFVFDFGLSLCPHCGK